MADRQTGQTTQQMLDAPKGSVFVWCNGKLDYPVGLARYIARLDLLLATPMWLERMSYQGRFAGREIVVDHAAQLTVDQRIGLESINFRRNLFRGVDSHVTVNIKGQNNGNKR